MKHSTFNIQRPTSKSGFLRVINLRRWMLNVECWMFLPLLLAGCVRYQPQPLSPEKNLAGIESRSLTNAARKVRSDLRNALLDFTAAQQREGLLQKQVALQEQNAKLLGQQREAGAISPNEATAASIALQKARLDFSDAQRQRIEGGAS